MDVEQLLADLQFVTAQRDRYRDALLKIICAPSIREARRIITRTFQEDNQCLRKPPRPAPERPA